MMSGLVQSQALKAACADASADSSPRKRKTADFFCWKILSIAPLSKGMISACRTTRRSAMANINFILNLISNLIHVLSKRSIIMSKSSYCPPYIIIAKKACQMYQPSQASSDIILININTSYYSESLQLNAIVFASEIVRCFHSLTSRIGEDVEVQRKPIRSSLSYPVLFFFGVAANLRYFSLLRTFHRKCIPLKSDQFVIFIKEQYFYRQLFCTYLMNFIPLESKSIKLKKETFYFFESGSAKKDKPTILLIHGHLSSKQCWIDIINDLKKQCDNHIVAVDLRGFGESTYNQKCVQLKNWADDLYQFCLQMKIQKCIPIGWSFGGLMSMKFAEIYPKLVDKVVLISSVGFQGLNIKNLMPVWQVLKKLIQQKKEQQYSKMFYGFLQSEKSQKYDACVAGTMRQRCIEDVNKLIQISDINLNAILPTLRNSFAIHGADDTVVQFSDFQKTGNFCKVFTRVDKVGHMIPFNFPQLVKMIGAFIE